MSLNIKTSLSFETLFWKIWTANVLVLHQSIRCVNLMLLSKCEVMDWHLDGKSAISSHGEREFDHRFEIKYKSSYGDSSFFANLIHGTKLTIHQPTSSPGTKSFQLRPWSKKRFQWLGGKMSSKIAITKWLPLFFKTPDYQNFDAGTQLNDWSATFSSTLE